MSAEPSPPHAEAEAELSLPEEPLVHIRPATSLPAVNLRDLWHYRELLYFLMWRDIKIRYKQTLLGAAWALLQPLCMMLLFSAFFGRIAPINSAVPYPLFALAGLVPWLYFANAVGVSGNSLVSNTHLITKVYFPRILMPMAAVLAGLVELALAFLLLGGMLWYYGVPLTTRILMLPVLIVLTTLCALGTGMWMSALNVKYRDVRFALPFIVQLWLFASSVILPSSAVPVRWRSLLYLNPMSPIIEAYRSALFGTPFDVRGLAVAAALTVLLLICATLFFRKTERGFADVI
jgi:ABC-type polysaccharide/polyol phosphate export systems, permease component